MDNQLAKYAASDNATWLGRYAGLLHVRRQDYDKAEEYYLKAIQADPDDATWLGRYAGLLHVRRQDYDKAEEYYLKAIQADPDNATWLGRYAQILLIKGETEKADICISKALKLTTDNLGHLAELWFYRYAHFEKYFDNAEKELKALLDKGAKSVGWNLKPNIEIAMQNGHPNISLLQEFVDRITKEQNGTTTANPK